MLTLLLLACAGTPTTSDDKQVDDSAAVTDDSAVDSADSAPHELTGEVPEDSFAAPEFTVLNHLGESRSRADLMGHPTVMWFFPSAGTFG